MGKVPAVRNAAYVTHICRLTVNFAPETLHFIGRLLIESVCRNVKYQYLEWRLIHPIRTAFLLKLMHKLLIFNRAVQQLCPVHTVFQDNVHSCKPKNTAVSFLNLSLATTNVINHIKPFTLCAGEIKKEIVVNSSALHSSKKISWFK